ncbi:MAG: hypothetical protein KIT84_44690 [Labilithrix sp.]|nr:hypothetical protein [Labilithrix sp.]MCW5818179.1 hypothetical protein [Labilithrix sp.]
MRRAHLLAAALGSVSLGCAPKPPPPVMQMPPATIEGAKPVAQRTPSKEIAVRFPYAANEEITTLAYSDLALLAKPELVQGVATSLAWWAKDVAGVDRACVDSIVGGAKEILVGDGQRGWVAVVRVPDHTLESTCTPDAQLASELMIEGTTKAWAFKENGRACATTPGWLACGHPEMVKLALAAGGDGLVPVSLDGDEVVTIDDRDNVRDLRLVAASTEDRFTARVELTFDSDDEARKIHEMLERPTELAPAISAESKATPEQQRLVSRIARNLVASHRAARASIRIELEEPIEAQVRDLTDFMGLVTSTLRTMKMRVRTEEARANLNHLAGKLAEAWESKDPKSPFAAKTKLVSFPAVPSTVPKRAALTSPADSWKAWSAVGWSVETPSFYQYEVIAAKDGQTADLVARGDLDGDGKVSTFTRHVRIDKSSKQLMIEDVVATEPE